MTLPITMAAAPLVMLGLGRGLRVLVRRLKSGHPVLPVTTDWLNELSTERYRPMLRLLDPAEFEFLRVHEGASAEALRRLRRQRVQAFRGYLGLLEIDFDRVATALQVMTAQSMQERPELSSLLLERRLRFAAALLGVRCRLMLFDLGYSRVDASGLLELFARMCMELHILMPVPCLATA